METVERVNIQQENAQWIASASRLPVEKMAGALPPEVRGPNFSFKGWLDTGFTQAREHRKIYDANKKDPVAMVQPFELFYGPSNPSIFAHDGKVYMLILGDINDKEGQNKQVQKAAMIEISRTPPPEVHSPEIDVADHLLYFRFSRWFPYSYVQLNDSPHPAPTSILFELMKEEKGFYTLVGDQKTSKIDSLLLQKKEFAEIFVNLNSDIPTRSPFYLGIHPSEFREGGKPVSSKDIEPNVKLGFEIDKGNKKRAQETLKKWGDKHILNKVTRRTILRTAVGGATALAASQLLGCGILNPGDKEKQLQAGTALAQKELGVPIQGNPETVQRLITILKPFGLKPDTLKGITSVEDALLTLSADVVSTSASDSKAKVILPSLFHELSPEDSTEIDLIAKLFTHWYKEQKVHNLELKDAVNTHIQESGEGKHKKYDANYPSDYSQYYLYAINFKASSSTAYYSNFSDENRRRADELFLEDLIRMTKAGQYQSGLMEVSPFLKELFSQFYEGNQNPNLFQNEMAIEKKRQDKNNFKQWIQNTYGFMPDSSDWLSQHAYPQFLYLINTNYRYAGGYYPGDNRTVINIGSPPKSTNIENIFDTYKKSVIHELGHGVAERIFNERPELFIDYVQKIIKLSGRDKAYSDNPKYKNTINFVANIWSSPKTTGCGTNGCISPSLPVDPDHITKEVIEKTGMDWSHLYTSFETEYFVNRMVFPPDIAQYFEIMRKGNYDDFK